MVSKQITVKVDVFNDKEPSLLCQTADGFSSQLYIEKGNRRANAKSIIGVFSLKLQNGDSVKVIAEGKDEDKALIKIIELLENYI